MPKQIKGNIKLVPEALLKKPHLAAHIPVLLTYWAEIEDRLAFLFAYAMHTRPVMAAVIFGRVNSVYVRLDMLEDALAFSISKKSSEYFYKTFHDEIRKCAGLRATLAHSMWTTRDDYPDCLIRFDGITEADGGFWAYNSRDFAELAQRFLALEIALTKFSQSLAVGQDFAGPIANGWRPHAPEPD